MKANSCYRLMPWVPYPANRCGPKSTGFTGPFVKYRIKLLIYSIVILQEIILLVDYSFICASGSTS